MGKRRCFRIPHMQILQCHLTRAVTVIVNGPSNAWQVHTTKPHSWRGMLTQLKLSKSCCKNGAISPGKMPSLGRGFMSKTETRTYIPGTVSTVYRLSRILLPYIREDEGPAHCKELIVRGRRKVVREERFVHRTTWIPVQVERGSTQEE